MIHEIDFTVWSSLYRDNSSRKFDPLGPNSEENEISLYIFTTCSNIQVMRIKELITKDKMS